MIETDEGRIIEIYQASDLNTRLNIYMQWRQLRSEFILIDRQELRANISSGKTDRKASWREQLGELFNTLAFGAKKLFGNASAS